MPCAASAHLCGAIPEIDIWRATRLMLERYGEPALDEGAEAEVLARAAEADNGVAVRRQTMAAVTQPANTSCRPARSTHRRNNWVYRVSGAQRGKRSRINALAPQPVICRSQQTRSLYFTAFRELRHGRMGYRSDKHPWDTPVMSITSMGMDRDIGKPFRTGRGGRGRRPERTPHSEAGADRPSDVVN
jgi:hypothetical protein